ncbi:hypothetical protein HK097_010204 [Rhizophlyctis rosea]|uniref:histidine kinase n=1 Tax=Rhizophlyctis rosea TaxID=64517 RepID=A0AAD5X2Q0_9FUNG|nr:hypothetical protein HK097_010204 [Rhizophlyctis rosea]
MMELPFTTLANSSTHHHASRSRTSHHKVQPMESFGVLSTPGSSSLPLGVDSNGKINGMGKQKKRREPLSPAAIKGLATAAGVVLMVLGCAIAIPIMVWMRREDRSSSMQKAGELCRAVAYGVLSELRGAQTLIQAYSWFFTSNLPITAESFIKFNNASEASDLRWKVVGVAYAPYILHSDRPIWESQWYNITELTDQAKNNWRAYGILSPIPAGDREAYLPYQFMSSKTSKFLGYDLLSAQEDKHLMDLAMMRRELMFDEPKFHRFRDKTLVKFAMPWYGPNATSQTRSPLVGMFTGSMELSRLFNHSVIEEARGVLTIDIWDSACDSLHIYCSEGSHDTTHRTTVEQISVPGGGRTYTVSCASTLPISMVPYIFLLLSIFLWMGVSILCARILLKMLRARSLFQTASERIGLLRTNAEALYRAISDPIFSFNTQGFIVDANHDALMITGYSREDLENGTVHIGSVFRGVRLRHDEETGVSIKIDIGRRESRSSLYGSSNNSLPRSFFSGRDVRCGIQDVQLMRKDGVALEAEANFSTSRMEGHMVQVVVFRDVTERRAAERQLQEAKDTAERVLQEKATFLTFICHQLRNPLHAVVGLSDLLLQASADRSVIVPGSKLDLTSSDHKRTLLHPELVDNLRYISEGARLMQAIVNDVLELHKLETLTVRMDHIPVDLGDLLESICRSQRIAHTYQTPPPIHKDRRNSGDSQNFFENGLTRSDSRVRLNYVFEDGQKATHSFCSDDVGSRGFQSPFLVLGDPLRLQQIMVNLISNSVRRTAQGLITVRIQPLIMPSVRSSSAERMDSTTWRYGSGEEKKLEALIRFEVEDTGVPIPMENIPALFQSYSRVNATVGSRFAGSGLGLSIVRTLVEMMGGKVHVASTDTGTRIWFDIWMEALTHHQSRILKEVAEEESATELGSPRGRFDESGSTSPMYMAGSRADLSAYATTIASRQTHTPEILSGVPTPPLTNTSTVPVSPTVPIVVEPPPEFEGLRDRRRLSRTGGELVGVSGTPPLILQVGRSQSGTFTSARFGPPPVQSTPYIDRSPETASPAEPSPLSSDDSRPTSVDSLRPLIAKTLVKPKISKNTGMHPTLGRPVRILVVEDNHLIQRMTQKMLSTAGFDVLVAGDGEEALRVIEGQGAEWFDVILMDLCMPIMGGMECVVEIRKRGWTVPVVALTANATDEDRTQCLQNGFSYFVSKPFQLPALLKFLKGIFGGG